MAAVTTHPLRFTTTDAELTELFERTREISDLTNLLALVRWDQQVTMPPAANQVRGPQLATGKALLHEHQSAPRLGELLTVLEGRIQDGSYTDADRGLVRQAGREYDQATKTPAALIKELTQAASAAWDAWRKAKPANDFALFAPHLQKLVVLKRQVAAHLGYQGSPYDAMLDRYAPGMTLDRLKPMLDRVRMATVDLLRRIEASGRQVETSRLQGTFEPAKQLDLCKTLLQQVGYQFEAGRLDLSMQAFASGYGAPFDVRVATRIHPAALLVTLRTTLHEGGHALYEQGNHPALARTILAGGASIALHEASAWLWDSHIGRSLPFWKHFFGMVREYFPETFAHCEAEALVSAFNEVKPGPLSTEADEVTHNLHMIIRFELEQELLSGEIEVADLPHLWKQKYRDYLGVVPRTDTEGVLQDVHWSRGAFGYFPIYTLGNLYAAQIDHALRVAFPAYETRLAEEGPQFILAWLHEHIYAYGQVYTPDELLRKGTGEDPNPEYFVRYLTAKFRTIYGLGT